MKDNYQDFNDEMQRDSLSFPQFTTNYDSSNRNSTNNSFKNENNKLKDKDEIINENFNMMKLKEALDKFKENGKNP